MKTAELASVRELLELARQQLAACDTARLDAELLLTQATGLSRAQIYADPELIPTSGEQAVFRELLTRRAAGEPIAYISGQREFWSLTLKVTPDVLIPRSDTELLVETALSAIPRDQPWRIAELGTGSGAIAIAIASERPRCEVHATEIEPQALKIASENADALAPGRVRFHLGSWFDPLQGKFQLIVSNPPYIDGGDPHLGQGDVRFEPRAALSPGVDGLAAIRIIAEQALAHLDNGGVLAFEHGCDQGCESRALLVKLGYLDVTTRKDLSGKERVTEGTLARD